MRRRHNEATFSFVLTKVLTGLKNTFNAYAHQSPILDCPALSKNRNAATTRGGGRGGGVNLKDLGGTHCRAFSCQTRQRRWKQFRAGRRRNIKRGARQVAPPNLSLPLENLNVVNLSLDSPVIIYTAIH